MSEIPRDKSTLSLPQATTRFSVILALVNKRATIASKNNNELATETKEFDAHQFDLLC